MSAHILVVEDERSLSEVYELILTGAGYTVELAYDGQAALDKLATFQPDIILLDLRMPTMGGLDFLEHYADLHKNDVHIIVFSNLDTQQDIDEAYRLGADRYLLKSWASPKELLQIVSDTLAQRTS